MTRQLPPLLAVLILSFAFMYEAPRGARAAGKPLVVIVGTSMPIKDISLATLRRAFQGEPTDYVAGKRLIPINLPPNTPERVAFDKAVMGLNPEEVGRFWIDRRIRDQSGPPKSVPSVDLAVRLVMSLPGAIGYVRTEMLNPRVQALTIDGKSPEQKGYSLE